VRRLKSVLYPGLAALLLAGAAGSSPAVAQERPTPTGTRLDFRDAPLAEVIRSLAAAMGLTAVTSEVPTDARISFTTAAPVTAAELPALLEGILESRGLVAVLRGSVAQVYASDKAPRTGQVRSGFDFPDPPPLGLVTQLVPLQGIRAEEGAEVLKQVAGEGASIEAVPRSNAVLITDRGTNVARYLDLLRRLDTAPQGESGLRTYVVNLKYANADDLAESLGQLFGISVARGGAVRWTTWPCHARSRASGSAKGMPSACGATSR
jgi:general secretion pathway protein D